MRIKLFLAFIAVSLATGAFFFWSVREDFLALSEKIEQTVERPDYQAYEKRRWVK